MAIRFDGTNAEFASTASGTLPSYSLMTITAVVKVTTDRNAYSTFFTLEKGGTSYGLVAQTDSDGTTLVIYDYSGKLICTVGPMVVGGYYGLAISSNGGGLTANGVKAYLRRLDVLGTTVTAQGSFGLAGYTGTINVLKLGETSFNEPLNGTVQNVQTHSVVLTQTEIEAAWMERGPAPAKTPVRWFLTNGPTLTDACDDYTGEPDLGVTGSLAYEAGYVYPAVTTSDTHTESVTAAAVHTDTLVPAPIVNEPLQDTVTPAEAFAHILHSTNEVDESATLTDTWSASVLSGSGLSDAFLSGGPVNAVAAQSLGGIKSSQQVTDRLFPRSAKAQYEAGLVRYRCIYPTVSALVTLRLFIRQQPATAQIRIGWGAAVTPQFSSDVFDAAPFSVANATISVRTVTESVSTSGHQLQLESRTFASGTRYSMEVKCKNGVGTRNLRMSFPSGAMGATSREALFNLQTGTIVSVHTGVTATIVAAEDGYWRCRIIANCIANTTDTIFLNLYSGTNSNYTGDGASSLVFKDAVFSIPDAKNLPEEEVATESTAPVNVVFSSPATEAAALGAGAMNDGDYRGLWIEQTLLDVDPVLNDSFVLEAVGV